MKYRTNNLVDQESIATAGTKIVDLDGSDVISEIVIQSSLTNATSVPAGHPAKSITKIEVVDGSEVIYSLSGIEAQAVSFFDKKAMPFNIIEYEAAITARAHIPLNFGRYLYDSQLALDPKKFNNLQLKITHNKALGGSTPTAGTISVYAKSFDEKVVTPTGFLRNIEAESYTLSASAAHVVDVPRDLPMRRIAFQSSDAGQSFTSQLETVKLSENSDKHVIFNDRANVFAKLAPNDTPIAECIGVLGTGSAQTVYSSIGYEGNTVATGRTAHQASLIAGQIAGGSLSVTMDASEGVTLNARGYLPHGCAVMELGNQQDPTDWFDPSSLSSLKATLTAGSGASGTMATVLQQYKRY